MSKIVISISALILALAVAAAVATKIVGHHTTCTQAGAFSVPTCKTSPGLW